MSLLFYKKPEYVSKEQELSQSSCQKYVERAQCSRAVIPSELSFDNVISGRSLPPCTLQDFLDYLVYVSHDAENLQFFLWLRDYSARFEALPPSEQDRSKPWTEHTTYPSIFKPHLRASGRPLSTTKTVSTMASTMKPLPKEPDLPGFPHSPPRDIFHYDAYASPATPLHNLPPRFSIDSTLRSQHLLSTPESPIKPPAPELLAQQPFREEIDRIASHYLVSGAPRELNISGRDRKLALQSLAHTTHPSALEHVGQLCEQALRFHSHRNFVRWSICNGNKPRVLVLRGVAAFVLGLCILACVCLILSPYDRRYRLAVAPLVFLGTVNLIAARQGLCVLLHRRNTREKRPWELDAEDPSKHPASSGAGSGMGPVSATNTTATGNHEATPWDSQPPPADGGEDGGEDGTAGPFSATKTFTPDSRRKQRLASLGPSNDYKHEAWVRRWERRSPWRKIRVQKVQIASNGGLHLIQNRIVWQAELWALFVTVIITGVVCAFPQFALW